MQEQRFPHTVHCFIISYKKRGKCMLTRQHKRSVADGLYGMAEEELSVVEQLYNYRIT